MHFATRPRRILDLEEREVAHIEGAGRHAFQAANYELVLLLLGSGVNWQRLLGQLAPEDLINHHQRVAFHVGRREGAQERRRPCLTLLHVHFEELTIVLLHDLLVPLLQLLVGVWKFVRLP